VDRIESAAAAMHWVGGNNYLKVGVNLRAYGGADRLVAPIIWKAATHLRPRAYRLEGLPIQSLEKVNGTSRILMPRCLLGPAIVLERRNLTPKGLTKLEYVGQSGGAAPGRIGRGPA
jgi:hypothetical protein